MHAAALFGQLNICKLLVGAGADLNLRNAEGQTALQVAQNSKQFEVRDFFKSVVNRTTNGYNKK